MTTVEVGTWPALYPRCPSKNLGATACPDTGGLDGDDGDPREMAAYLRHMRRELGGGAGPDFDQTIDELEAEAFAEEHGLGLDDDLESE